MNAFRTQVPRLAAAGRAFSTSTPRQLAKIQLIGRLAAPAEATPTSTGREVIKYALGVSHGPKNEDGERAVSWFRLASFVEGPQRDLLLSLPKGTQLYVEAEARMDSYTAADGSNRSSLNLLTRSFETLSRPRQTSEGGAEEAAAASA